MSEEFDISSFYDSLMAFDPAQRQEIRLRLEEVICQANEAYKELEKSKKNMMNLKEDGMN